MPRSFDIQYDKTKIISNMLRWLLCTVSYEVAPTKIKPCHNSPPSVFSRPGEFVIKVMMHNLVSSASLDGHIFVTSEHCLPPPVKNMGPAKMQVYVPHKLFFYCFTM